MVSHTSNGLCPVLNKNEEKRKEKGAHTFVSPVPQMEGIYVTGGQLF